MNPLHILLIEDNKADAELIEELIKDTGVAHSLTWIGDGQKALEFFDSGREADFILLDLNIPKISGHQLVRYISERDIDVPIIISTGSTFPIDLELVKEKGVACYLVKPVTIEEMEQMTITLKGIFLGERSCNC